MQKQKILEFCETKFTQLGFWDISLDHLAKELRISKKTFYKYFDSKDEIIQNVVESVTTKIADAVQDIVKSDGTSPEKLYRLIEFISRRFISISEKWLNDLSIHYPHLWANLEDFRENMINKNLTELIIQGQNEGYIKEYPVNLIMAIYLSSIRGVANPKFIMNNNMSIEKAGTSVLTIITSGILTRKGNKVFKNYLSENKNE
ncbi:MAG: TetR/AcrR family transcriptional regulator [Melioribacteraceae bacterium]|nr:TetR/AcrR family transcriptional regulator [Melioribacteraceae bacterium]MCO6474821.1 TetR/AcrR family transcriptional regulator [Melioribacteraceae bacterium]MDD3559506.1 TetR/AcrR family transcriptional regulator [Melioribacteraceae bacterium]